MCPYDLKHSGLSTKIREEVWKELEDWERDSLEI